MTKLLTRGCVLMLLLAGGAGGAAAQSAAQSLGPPTTGAWIGVPLDLSVPVRFATTDIRADCVQAEVFYGAQRLQPHQVRTSLSGGDPLRKRVRVQADLPIDEPVVTVSLRAGCGGALTRKYTLLPEIPSEQVLASLPARAAAAPQSLAQALGVETTASAAAPVRAAAPRRMARTAEAGPAATVAAAARVPEPPLARSQPIVAVAATAPRLRLEPLEMDSAPALRASGMLAQPQGDEGRRATAALLWQAINADPAERMRTTARLQALERDLAGLQRHADRNRADIEGLRQGLGWSQPWYASAGAAQILGLLVAVLAAAAAASWWRARRAGAHPAWYAAPAAPPFAPAGEREEPLAAGPEPLAGENAKAGAAAPSVPSALPAGAAEPPHLPTAAPPLRVETLAGIFEEVDFLRSLGLRFDAADVLKAYLEDSATPAPVAYLELMRACVQGRDRAGLLAVRRRYARVFGSEPPPLDRVTAPAGVERLPAVAERVCVAWRTGDAPAAIEDLLFGVPDGQAPLTLKAARELLFLHALARRLEDDTPEGSAEAEPQQAALAPWAGASDPAAAHALACAAEADPLVLDLDLDAAPAQADGHADGLAFALDDPELAPLLAEMQAAAREAQDRAADARLRQEQEEAFNLATAAERSVTRL